MEDQYFKDLFTTRWYQLRQGKLSNEKLEYYIDSITTYIDAAQTRNYERWPILGEYVWPNYDWQGNDYEDEVEYFETWLFNRVFWIDNNVPGDLLFPSAELSGDIPELTINLTDDYFSREILKKKYFTLNDAPAGLEIDTVIYQNASQAKVILSGSINNPTEVSLTMQDKILNSFEDVTSNDLIVSASFDMESKSKIKIFTVQNTIYLECGQPELLGDKLEIFNLSGQQIQASNIERTHMNGIAVDLPKGIYLCSYVFDGKRQSRRVVFVR